MASSTLIDETPARKEWKRYVFMAMALAAATIIYNAAEGVISMWFGVSDETLTLLGFGIDSFIEVISGIGIMHLMLRIKAHGSENRDKFEATALRVTGTAFYILTAGLVVTAFYNIWIGHRPQTSPASVIIALASLATMWALMAAKLRVGKRLDSAAIMADAACTRTCIYMSAILLGAALIYAWTGIPYLDSLGALGLAYFTWKEGKECFANAKNPRACSGCC